MELDVWAECISNINSVELDVRKEFNGNADHGDNSVAGTTFAACERRTRGRHYQVALENCQDTRYDNKQ